MKEINNTRTFLDVIITLNAEGREAASKLFSQQYFFVAETPNFMKDLPRYKNQSPTSGTS